MERPRRTRHCITTITPSMPMSRGAAREMPHLSWRRHVPRMAIPRSSDRTAKSVSGATPATQSSPWMTHCRWSDERSCRWGPRICRPSRPTFLWKTASRSLSSNSSATRDSRLSDGTCFCAGKPMMAGSLPYGSVQPRACRTPDTASCLTTANTSRCMPPCTMTAAPLVRKITGPRSQSSTRRAAWRNTRCRKTSRRCI